MTDGGVNMNRNLVLEKAGKRIYQLDLLYDSSYNHSSGYIIKDSRAAIIETGTSISAPLYMKALESIGIRKDDVAYIIVTHIHLDHAGGVGTLMQMLPEAKLIVHPRGASHLINPEKLIASARVVYGDRYEGLFGDIIPVEEKRIVTSHEDMILDTGERFLAIYESPGHSFHHIIVHSPQDGGIWSGDTAGIYFPQFLRKCIDFTSITTTPTQFDPVLMKNSLQFMSSLSPSVLYLTHFGLYKQPQKIIERSVKLVDLFVECARSIIGSSQEENSLFHALLRLHRDELIKEGLKADDPLISLIESDCRLNAQGLLYYLRKEKSSPSPAGNRTDGRKT